ncbi:MAG: glycosyltransferase, partial [Gammaproteobacteria bacterium]|nr:glycosyltransferase [Gammaproteobacteria bacterium]
MRLSIIIIEYHCMHQVADCIASIDQHLPDIEKECLVISNSEYSRNELAAYQKQFSDATIIDAHGNLGYAGGVNTGIKHAKGEYLYVLNPDCLLTDSNVNLMMHEMDKDPEWAIAGPKVVDEAGEVQPSCRRFPRPWTFLLVRSVLSKLPGAAKEKSRYLMEDFDRNSTKEVPWVSGGATLVKSS